MTIAALVASGPLRMGAKGDAVKRIQHALLEAGFDPKGIDGGFGDNTAAAVDAFRVSAGLAKSGVVDAAMAPPTPRTATTPAIHVSTIMRPT
jgi:peptidoglycan hydrolase-like protein with peptidoglycan-binding domain